MLFIFITIGFTFCARAIYDCFFELNLFHLLFMIATYDMWHSVAQFPVVHVTMLQFLLKSKLIIDGSGTKCKSYCNEDNCNLENNPELCYLSFNTIL